MEAIPLSKALSNWCQGRDMSTAFQDLLGMLLCECTPHWIDPDTKRPVGRYTDAYLELIKSYPKDHIRTFYPPVLKALLAEYNNKVTPSGGWCDPLGAWYEEYVGSMKEKQRKGLFLTPETICDLMAQINAPDPRKPVSLSVNDPACGSGRCLIAFDRACHPGSNNWYVGVDIDWSMCAIAAINFFFHGMRGVIIHGNSLSNEIFKGYRIWHPETGMGIEHLNAEQCHSYLFQKSSKANAQDSEKTRIHIDHEGEQLSLF